MIKYHTWEFPRVVAVEVEEGDELDVEALALHLTPEVELHEFFLRRVEPEPRHHDVVFVLVLLAARAVFLVVVHGCCNCHKTMAEPLQRSIGPDPNQFT